MAYNPSQQDDLTPIGCVVVTLFLAYLVNLVFMVWTWSHASCFYSELAAKVVNVTGRSMYDQKNACDVSIEWTPLHTPWWSFRTMSDESPYLQLLHLPCPKSNPATDEQTFLAGCYDNNRRFVHVYNEDDVYDIMWFRFQAYVAALPFLAIALTCGWFALKSAMTVWNTRKIENRGYRECAMTTNSSGSGAVNTV
jgi:hypothetical protein